MLITSPIKISAAITTFIALFTLSFPSLSLPEDEMQLIKIQANSAQHDEKKGLTIYQGDVQFEQGSLKVSAEKITIQTNHEGDVSQVIASGKPATFEQQPEAEQAIVYASANMIKYNISAAEISFKGQARLKQGESQLKSDIITYLENQQIFRAQRNNDENADGQQSQQRVEMIIPPKKRLKSDEK